jgi:polysaccharide chain length determinant protein (PEP-CTERM system associated)
MIRNGEISKSEVKRILRKYWWILPITTVGGLALALGASFFLPNKFTSHTLVLVEQQQVSADLVKPVITEASNQHLASMKEQILSRSRLQPIIEKFGLYPSMRDKAHMEDLVAKLRSTIEVTPLEAMQGMSNRQLPGFHVNVTSDNPQIAQRICTEITTMFMEQNSQDIDTQNTQTTEFFAQQVEEAKRKLDDQDAKLAEFQKKYMGSLPDQEKTNLELLSGMNSQLDAVTQALTRSQQDKGFNESLLSSQLANWKMAKVGEAAPETMEQQLTALQDQLTSLQSRYTPDHPDVIKAKSQIEQLRKRMADAPKAGSGTSNAQGGIEPPAVQQLRAKLRQDDLNIADLAKRQGQIQSQINVLQGRIQSTPAVEQQFKELSRNYQTAQEFYNDLQRKHDQAAMSRDLNRQQQGEQFRVLDPPSLPMSPSFPNKPLFAGVGFGGGLALGLATLYLLAALDSSMHSERDVEVCLKLPVLAMVPTLSPAGRSSGMVVEKGKGFGYARTRA